MHYAKCENSLTLVNRWTTTKSISFVYFLVCCKPKQAYNYVQKHSTSANIRIHHLCTKCIHIYMQIFWNVVFTTRQVNQHLFAVFLHFFIPVSGVVLALPSFWLGYSIFFAIKHFLLYLSNTLTHPPFLPYPTPPLFWQCCQKWWLFDLYANTVIIFFLS